MLAPLAGGTSGPQAGGNSASDCVVSCISAASAAAVTEPRFDNAKEGLLIRMSNLVGYCNACRHQDPKHKGGGTPEGFRAAISGVSVFAYLLRLQHQRRSNVTAAGQSLSVLTQRYPVAPARPIGSCSNRNATIPGAPIPRNGRGPGWGRQSSRRLRCRSR